MSVVEDVRKTLQDFLAPELRAVTARLDAIDSKLAAQDKVLAAQEKTTETRFAAYEKTAEARHNEILARLESLKNSFEFDKRIERLESRQPS
jgi:hypothetical protein